MYGRNRQADPVNSDRTLLNYITRRGGWKFHDQMPTVVTAVEINDLTFAVNVTLNDMAAETGIGSHRPATLAQ